MYLKDVAKIIYVPETASENNQVTVAHYYLPNDILFRGTAKELQDSNCAKQNWLVVEICVDPYYKSNNDIPDYNKPKLITVV